MREHCLKHVNEVYAVRGLRLACPNVLKDIECAERHLQKGNVFEMYLFESADFQMSPSDIEIKT
jgi:hypothetical protein